MTSNIALNRVLKEYETCLRRTYLVQENVGLGLHDCDGDDDLIQSIIRCEVISTNRNHGLVMLSSSNNAEGAGFRNRVAVRRSAAKCRS
jgi:hypothetical protein